jgi:hypothetical protein
MGGEQKMINPAQLETAFQEFSTHLNRWVPDGITQVNLAILQELGLLSHSQLESNSTEQFMHYFHIIESQDKVTLFNEQFAIWIVPASEQEKASTLTYISLLNIDKPHLELVFSTSGVYNTPKYILRILQHFLNEVLDTEAVISAIGKKKT